MVLLYFEYNTTLLIFYTSLSIHSSQSDQSHRILTQPMVHISHSHKMEHRPKEHPNTPKQYLSNNCYSHLLPYYFHHRTLFSIFIFLLIFHLRKFSCNSIFAHFDLYNSNLSWLYKSYYTRLNQFYHRHHRLILLIVTVTHLHMEAGI